MQARKSPANGRFEKDDRFPTSVGPVETVPTAQVLYDANDLFRVFRLNKTTLQRHIKAGLFPKPVHEWHGGSSKRLWSAVEVNAWARKTYPGLKFPK